MGGRVALRTELLADRQAPARARAAIDRLEGHIERKRLRVVRLLVSELVANSVRHGARSPAEHVCLEACVDDRSLRVAVRDSGESPAELQARRVPASATAGRGLWLVSKLSDRWGTDLHDGTRVWFELDLADDARVAPAPARPGVA